MNITGLKEGEFEFKYSGFGSVIIVAGNIEWDKEQKKWKATITQGSSNITVYDDDSPTAATKAILEWLH